MIIRSIFIKYSYFISAIKNHQYSAQNLWGCLLDSGDINYQVISQVRLLYPIMGIPEHDKERETSILTVLADDIIKEIALNLSMTLEPIYDVLKRLLDSRLIKMLGDNRLVIPDFPVFCMFVDVIGNFMKYGY